MWQQKVNEFMKSEGAFRVNGRKASERTKTLTKEVLCASIRRLHQLGYRIQDPKNLGERHIQVLVKDWWYCRKKKIKTIQNDLSRLRVVCEMLGKPGMVDSVGKYLPDVDPKLLTVRSATKTTKSWSGNGIDLVAKLREVDERQPRLGLMLRLELGFGLRREEVLKCNPHAQDYGHYLQIFPGMGKGGRWRNIPIASTAQRELLDYVKARVPKNKPLGWDYTRAGEAASLEQNIRRYENLMASFGFTKADAGVTGHGLRAQFAENYALLLGMMPPTMGGEAGQRGSADESVLKVKVAQALGHNRPSVTSAYIGSFSSDGSDLTDDLDLEAIQKVLRFLEIVGLPTVPPERVSDCQAIRVAMARFGLAMSEEQIHMLWAKNSRRNGVEWMTPEHEIPLVLRASAEALLNDVLL
ncbi:integrase domain-containing protein [Massilia sp. YIM B02769]|uniref:site-specific integrase n=1 Tax=Massilia sp. YIM B02769 TaxID=3050129 RepID=UPI0025B6C604|nr:site-specific integrase [Massilia sp. YIM B02769]MDN4058024.1 integrase domain-containing protein [Massilia sp. YIM B02769]